MKSIAALVFPGFETLDLFGPIEMFGMLPEEFDIKIVAERMDPVSSRPGQRILPDHTLAEGTRYDLFLVPGGPGTPIEQVNPQINEWLHGAAQRDSIVMGVCTGSTLLARAGVLDGRKATTNKMDFRWSVPFGPNVIWAPKARWVEDGNFFTSSGVSAGMDMSLAVIGRLLGVDKAREIAAWTEYDWHEDPTWDPFAELYEL